ncbi:MAG: asparaginase [Chitinophagales bacterium]|nr:asparaginase [Chitinophagales bacterium]
MSALKIFITGGTFDKEYDLINGRLFFQDTHIEEMLLKGRSTILHSIQTLMMIDSLDMTDADRNIILENCRACAEERIIVTHGTDTMTETAIKLGAENLAKTIILTGAMVPYTFGSSDGMFNLGSSMAYAQCLPHGVYVVMNGKAYQWDNVIKNKKTGFFEPIS